MLLTTIVTLALGLSPTLAQSTTSTAASILPSSVPASCQRCLSAALAAVCPNDVPSPRYNDCLCAVRGPVWRAVAACLADVACRGHEPAIVRTYADHCVPFRRPWCVVGPVDGGDGDIVVSLVPGIVCTGSLSTLTSTTGAKSATKTDTTATETSSASETSKAGTASSTASETTATASGSSASPSTSGGTKTASTSAPVSTAGAALAPRIGETHLFAAVLAAIAGVL
ncbi:hypothetical protein ACCO45_013511 [Purpureocillium lilacinum]|uniref:Uncharacterized protein n=1 Tax=Purpureocillium lilacinum TaxID=33203 RepID=A0ACC4D860_PURLI